MIGLESHRPDLTDYRQCIDLIESHVKNFTAAELEEMNAREKQAGVTALKWEDFKETEHVSIAYLNHVNNILIISGPNIAFHSALGAHKS